MASDDDLASYDPTSPQQIIPKKSTAGARSSKPPSRSGAVASSSKQPTGTKRKKSPRINNPESDSDDLYGPPDPLHEPLENTEVKVGKSGGGNVKVQMLPDVNGRAKGKGKAKADPPSRTAAIGEPMEVVDDDAVEVIEDEDGGILAKHTTTRRAKAKAPPVATARSAKYDRELARLKQRLAETEAHRDTLSKQLEELFQVRHTAAEESLDHQSTQYEARLKTQEALIQELTSQLARVEPLARSGKTSLLHFLTRDAADEEQRGLEDEISRWKGVVKDKEAVIFEKDKRIAELERTERDMRYELNAEIERSKSLLSRSQPGSAPRSHPRPGGGGGGVIFGADEPKNTAVIKFYEDLTNLLVPGLRFEPGKYLGLDETCFTCIYTHMDLDSEDAETGLDKSLTFTLRFYYDINIPEDQRSPGDEHVTSPDQLIQRIKYTPLELDKESDEFVRKLQFLGEAFTFGRDQLALFLKTMYDTLSGALTDEEGG